jgi:hypothetical protein
MPVFLGTNKAGKNDYLIHCTILLDESNDDCDNGLRSFDRFLSGVEE